MSFRRLFGRCNNLPDIRRWEKQNGLAVQDPNAKRQEKSAGRVTECYGSQNCVFEGLWTVITD